MIKPVTLIDTLIQQIHDKTDLPIILIPGVFDIVHIGHMRLIDYASTLGGYIIIAVMEKEQGQKTYFSGLDRKKMLERIRFIDEVIIVDFDYLEFIKKLRPEFIIKGEERKLAINAETQILAEYGGELIFHSGDYHHDGNESLTDAILAHDIEFVNPMVKQNRCQPFIDRHGIDINALDNFIDRFKDIHIGVIGDAIIDKYMHCSAVGMSREDPTIVVTPEKTETFIGGAAIVAAHAQSLGATTSLFTVIGADDHGNFLKKTLEEQNLDCHMIEDKTRKTVSKTR